MTSSDTKKAKRNEWLSIGDSDAEDDDGAAAHDSEDDLHASRGTAAAASGGRSSKRRRIEKEEEEDDEDEVEEASGSDDASEQGEEDDEEEEEEEEEDSDGGFDKLVEAAKSKYTINKKPTKPSVNDDSALLPNPDDGIITKPSQMQPLTKSELTASKSRVRKTGVVYLSRIPPFMKPQKVKHLLSRFGEVGRIFLAPEDPKSYKKRVKFGGNKKRNFDEGWVEFTSKKKAKTCAETLNAQQIGGKKGNYYYDDVWNIKYLPKFKWHHLTEQIANENASKQARLRAEIAQSTRENKRYIRNVERAKMIENMQASKKRKLESESIGNAATAVPKAATGAPPTRDLNSMEIRRKFRQNTAIIEGKSGGKAQGGGADKDQQKALQTLLGKIF